MEIMMFVTMLAALFAGHYAQKCYGLLRDRLPADPNKGIHQK